MVINVLGNKTQQQGLDKEIFENTSVSLFENEYPKFDEKKFIFFMCGGLSFAELAGLRNTK